MIGSRLESKSAGAGESHAIWWQLLVHLEGSCLRAGPDLHSPRRPRAQAAHLHGQQPVPCLPELHPPALPQAQVSALLHMLHTVNATSTPATRTPALPPSPSLCFCFTHTSPARHPHTPPACLRVRWLAFFDADEFLVFEPSTGLSDLNLALVPYEGAGAVGVNWRMFSSSGHVVRPREGPLTSYTHCIPTNHTESTHVKVGCVFDGLWGGHH